MSIIYTILIGVFGLAGVVASVWSWKNMSKGKLTESWTKIQGKIVTSQPSVNKNTLMPLIEYSYTVANESYKNTLKLTSGETQMPGHSENFVKKHPLDSSIDLYYDPENPGNSTLEIGPRSDDVFIFWISVIALVLCIVYIIFNV